MFDSPPDFFSLVIAIAALIFARKAYVDARRLRARLDAIEAKAPTIAMAPPPLPTEQAPEIAPDAEPITAAPSAPAETATPPDTEPQVTATATADAAAPSPPPL